MRLALYQPDIPQNTGTILRMAACLNTAIDIIGPAGFDISDRNLKRAGLDYLKFVDLTRHVSWEAFLDVKPKQSRLVLFSSRGDTPYTNFTFLPDDILIFGRESAGVPEHVHNAADARLTIPMRPEVRSLNLAVACAMSLGEALRQTGGLPAS